jgi:tRNA G18 (ribose-2'-O)-methylase SpoU
MTDHEPAPTRRRLAPPEASARRRAPFYALLDDVRSVWNVGSMFRTADAVGLGGLYLCGLTATPPRADMEKTALGATLTVPWDYWPRAEAAVAALRTRRITIVALEQSAGARPFDGTVYTFPVCFVVGHEVRGVTPAVLALADDCVEIPMDGGKQSLNVAVSFGVMAYELRRQWLALPAVARDAATAAREESP